MTNNDELERARFEAWFENKWREQISTFPFLERRRLKQIAWWGWLERSKQEG